ncbi:MAG: hypothetical protein K1060chlam2_01363 [Chlamydiae bacterium]|nr:hypothetical protein [Chlamydiota bacterium]
MAEQSKEEATKTKLQLLLYQLGELLNEPPTTLDLPDWRDNVTYIMEEIRDISELAFNHLEDLVAEVVRLGEVHVADLDEDAPPKQTERTGYDYFKQVGFVSSEINSLKST